MYGFLKLVMYAGVAMSLISFAGLANDVQLNLGLPYSTKDILAFGGLGLVIIGFAGRQLTKPAESETGSWE